MNVLYINHYAGSLVHGMEFRPYYLAKEWQRMGHRVTIIAGDYSHLRTENPVVLHDFQTEIHDGIEYCWVKTGSYLGNGLKRAFSMFRFVSKLYLNARKLAEEFKPDIVISSSTYPLDAYPVSKIAKLAGAKHIHEIHDMWPATLIELGGMSKYHPFVLLMSMAEKFFCMKADTIVSMLPNTMEYLVKRGARIENICVIPNGVVMDDWDNPEDLPDTHRLVLERLQQEGKFVVGYFGGHALSNALDVIIDTASQCEIPKMHFVFVGDGIEKNRIVQRAKDERIKNVTFLDPINKRAIPRLLEQYDIVIIPGKDSRLYRFGGSINKLCDSMMAKKPILMILDIALNPVELTGCGIVVKSPSLQNEIHDALRIFYEMSREELEEMGEKGKIYVESEHDYRKLAAKFSKCFYN